MHVATNYSEYAFTQAAGMINSGCQIRVSPVTPTRLEVTTPHGMWFIAHTKRAIVGQEN